MRRGVYKGPLVMNWVAIGGGMDVPNLFSMATIVRAVSEGRVNDVLGSAPVAAGEVARVVQAFADEIFRVFANAHPEVELLAVNALPEVQQMIRRAEVLRDEQGDQLPLLK